MVGIYLKMSPEDLCVLEEVTCPVHGEPEVLGKYIGLTARRDNDGETDFRRPSDACVCVFCIYFFVSKCGVFRGVGEEVWHSPRSFEYFGFHREVFVLSLLGGL